MVSRTRSPPWMEMSGPMTLPRTTKPSLISTIDTLRAAGVLRCTIAACRTVPVPALRSVRSSLPPHTGHSSRWYIAVPHQVQRWKVSASRSPAAGSSRAVAEPAAAPVSFPEGWYTLVNSLRWAGIPRAGEPVHGRAARGAAVHTTEYGTQCRP
ncbi:hypothetical protein CF54_13320 [Streptomyces sp. Tu 6176]|nr:hypothetical protein CF54_13320 [Streptomyces sp. Tu 6176]